jgi:bifunctional non-homologous end joining protein LigD
MARRRSGSQLPDFVPFQHPKTVETPPRGAGWRHEIKLDGYRVQVRIQAGSVTWRTREGLDWSSRFPDLTAQAADLPDGILDAELCVLGPNGQPDFVALQRALGRRQTGHIEGDLVVFLFDLLWEARSDLRPLPLAERLDRLAVLAEPVLGPTFRLAQPLPGSGPALLDAACRLELEGIVSKRLEAPYEGGDVRRDTWVKSKCRPSGEVVIGGWRTEKGRFRSLLAGQMEDGKLRYVGRIHTGYSAAKVAELLPKLQRLEASRPPFELGELPSVRGIRWVKPELVARVTYAEITSAGKLRQAAYHGLRDDKAPEHVAAERPEPAPASPAAPVRRRGAKAAPEVDKPDKPLWPATNETPAVTKADLAAYYEAVAPWLIPHVGGRPCTLVMAPEGVTGEQTYVRHEGHWRGALRTSPLITHWTVAEKGKTYPGFDTPDALVVAADLGVVEIHPWNSVPGDPSLPGRLVFDLDSDAAHGFGDVLRAAFELRDRLAAYGLAAFLKTSGQRGAHVVTPFLQASHDPTDWPESRAFGKRVCEEMAADSPDRYTTALPKAQRRGRLFLDYLRNDPGHHAVGLLSPRVAPTATVSMPVSWTEAAAGLANSDFTIRNAVQRLKRRRPWAGYDKAAAPLPG